MSTRINPYSVDAKAMEPLMALEAYFEASSLERSLCKVVKTRAPQING